jgi:hypothetical protein
MIPQVCLLTKEQAAQHWKEIEWRIDATPSMRRFYAKEDIVDKVFKDEMQVWTAGEDLVLLTAILTTPGGKIFQIIWAHGSGLTEHFAELREKFNLYAWMTQCFRIEVLGRQGWAKKFRKELGFKIDYVAYGCEVQKPRMH